MTSAAARPGIFRDDLRRGDLPNFFRRRVVSRYTGDVPKPGPHVPTRALVGRNLTQLISATGTNPNDLSRRSRVSRSQIYKIMNETSGASVDLLGQLADALGVPVASFFGPADPS